MAAHQISKIKALVPLLVSWFATNARDVPWRRTRDPYAIWVSEIMLQQTQVKTVIPYWQRWMRELPTIRAAAKASPARLHKLWEGLGYYPRVRNLQKAARQILARHDGKFPENFDDILALPGIGRYTAGAIASIAFDQPHPILDGNVVRVLARIFGIAADPREKKTNARLWQIAGALVREASRINSPRSGRPREALTRRPSAFDRRSSDQGFLTPAATRDESSACSQLNQSLMELGALVCTPRRPRCELCPVKRHCIARHRGWQEELPRLGERKTTTARRFTAFVVERNGRFLVRQRPAGVVNAHLWEFPSLETGARASGPQRAAAAGGAGFRFRGTGPFTTIKHSITRYRITLDAHRAELANARAKPDGLWLSRRQLTRLAFSSAHKKILARLGPERRAPGRRAAKSPPATRRIGDRRT
jgi:A/G-specific adenine glycosylase